MSGLVNLSQSSSLEHRSSLRKLPFPQCTQEALIRLGAHCAHWAQAKPAPREIDVVLDAIEEFIFNFGQKPGSKTSSASSSLDGNTAALLGAEGATAVQELQMLQVLLDFFAGSGSDSELHLSFTMFLFLFMEGSAAANKGGASSQGGAFMVAGEVEEAVGRMSKRTAAMAKMVGMAMSTKNKAVLECCGLWLHHQSPFSERSLQLAFCLSEEFVLLVQDPVEDLKDIPEISPLFASNLLAAMTQLYDLEKNRPPNRVLLSLSSSWLSSHPLLPVTSNLNSIQSQLPPSSVSAFGGGGGGAAAGATGAGQAPYVGLARWAALGVLKDDHTDSDLQASYSLLQLCVLEGLVEASAQRGLLKAEAIPVKKVVALILDVSEALDESGGGKSGELNEDEQTCLDRLGQFLQAVTSSGLLSGKTAEIITALKRLPKSKLIEMFVGNLLKF